MTRPDPSALSAVGLSAGKHARLHRILYRFSPDDYRRVVFARFPLAWMTTAPSDRVP